MAAVSAAATGASAIAQSRQANANAAATQAEVDRQTNYSRELFDDRNNRLIEANDEMFGVSGEQYDIRRTERRDTESEIARILGDAVRTQGDIEARVAGEKNEAAGGYNALLAGARERAAGFAREGDAAVDNTVKMADFSTSEAARLESAARRAGVIEGNINTGPSYIDVMGDVPAAVAKRLQADRKTGVDRARAVGTAGANVASYADNLRRTDEVLQDGSEDLAAIGSKANRDLKKLGAGLTPFQVSYEGAEKVGEFDIANVLAASERQAGFEAERGGRVIQASSDYETSRGAIIDDYVTSLNSSSTAYEDALRRNGQIRLSGLSNSSPMAGLFGAIGSAAGGAASGGRGPSWGKVGSYLSGLGARPALAGGSNYLPPSF
ncbi:hypothetical protein T8K17_11205 [Thalassobaculum sp. OXR-137]|uniref:hypothetical protein n=1 Tax=Thalassobaculum sp. OXR-137 TaxID=3100173 RepID=UPI002AC8D7CB|nr:hypothetical protein [Thalassobaculum sp. OXR-137]WPZ36702.1 hypothetical protein T8K17_11205 [Thalassobaculum sp. OXR-137]